MRRSMTTTSGRRVSILASASSPSTARPTISIPSAPRTSQIASTIAGWSSATRQVIERLSDGSTGGKGIPHTRYGDRASMGIEEAR